MISKATKLDSFEFKLISKVTKYGRTMLQQSESISIWFWSWANVEVQWLSCDLTTPVFSQCPCGFPQGYPVSLHLSNHADRWIGYNKLLQMWICVYWGSGFTATLTQDKAFKKINNLFISHGNFDSQWLKYFDSLYQKDDPLIDKLHNYAHRWYQWVIPVRYYVFLFEILSHCFMYSVPLFKKLFPKNKF